MVTKWARRWSEQLIAPLVRFLARIGLTPNALTWIGFVLTAAVAAVLAAGGTQIAGALLILTLGVDGLDGSLARLTGATSRFGAFLDSTLDRWAEVLIFGALAWRFAGAGQSNGILLAMAAMAASLLVSYTRARAEGVGLPIKEGLFTRLERLIVLIAGLIINQLEFALAIIALLAGFTAIQRIWITWRMDQATP